MKKRAAITLLATNMVATLGAAILFIFIYSRAMPDSGVDPEQLDIAAARLAAHPSQTAISEALRRDDSYIQALLRIGDAQRTLLCWSAMAFASVAAINVFYVLPVVRQSNRDA